MTQDEFHKFTTANLIGTMCSREPLSALALPLLKKPCVTKRIYLHIQCDADNLQTQKKEPHRSSKNGEVLFRE
jgi:hypothetical protein